MRKGEVREMRGSERERMLKCGVGKLGRKGGEKKRRCEEEEIRR